MIYKFLNRFRDIFKKNNTSINRPLLINIEVQEVETNYKRLDRPPYDSLKKISNYIDLIELFNCDCIQIKWHKVEDISSTLLLVKKYLLRLHPHWICHGIIITYDTHSLITNDLSKIASFTKNLHHQIYQCIKYHVKYFIYCADLNLIHHIHEDQLAERLKKINLSIITYDNDFNIDISSAIANIQLCDNHSQKSYLRLISSIIKIRKNIIKISQKTEAINFKINSIILDSSYSFESGPLLHKYYRFRILEIFSKFNNKINSIILLLILIFIIVLSYRYNKNITQHITSKHKISTKLSLIYNADKTQHYLYSLPYINIARERQKIYHYDLSKLRRIAKHEIKISLDKQHGADRGILLKQKNIENSYTSRHIPYQLTDQIKSLYVLPSVLTNSVKLPYLDTSLKDKQSYYLSDLLLNKYLSSHIPTASQAIIFLNKKSLIQTNLLPTTMSNTEQLYKKLQNDFKTTHDHISKVIILFSENLLLKQLIDDMNHAWHQSITHKITAQVAKLHQLGIRTNIDTDNNIALNRSDAPVVITPDYLSSNDELVELTVGSQTMIYSHGPLMSFKFSSTNLSSNSCKLTFKDFNNFSTTKSINQQHCLAVLLIHSQHDSSGENREYITLTAHHQIFKISMPIHTFTQITTQTHHLPHRLKLIGESYAA